MSSCPAGSDDAPASSGFPAPPALTSGRSRPHRAATQSTKAPPAAYRKGSSRPATTTLPFDSSAVRTPRHIPVYKPPPEPESPREDPADHHPLIPSHHRKHNPAPHPTRSDVQNFATAQPPPTEGLFPRLFPAVPTCHLNCRHRSPPSGADHPAPHPARHASAAIIPAPPPLRCKPESRWKRLAARSFLSPESAL